MKYQLPKLGMQAPVCSSLLRGGVVVSAAAGRTLDDRFVAPELVRPCLREGQRRMAEYLMILTCKNTVNLLVTLTTEL